MKKALSLMFVIFHLSFLGNNIKASPIADTWFYATIRIENEWGERGTGFLVARTIDANSSRIFLCTNKHVLNKDEKKRQTATKIICHLNETTKDNKIVNAKHELSLMLPNGTKRWKEHPDKDVDVLVFDITDLIIQRPNMVKKWATYDLFADKDILSQQDITIGEEILVLGYPDAIPRYKSNLPIVRQGIIASQIGDKYEDEYKNKKRILRGFLIDGGVIPGSSGSPVILKPVTGRYVKKELQIKPTSPYLLGIVSETRKTYISSNDPNDPNKINYTPSYAGLGFVFDASTIKETIELFFENKRAKE